MLLSSVAVPVKLAVIWSTLLTKEKLKFADVPDMEPDIGPVSESVRISSHVVLLRIWTPAALMDPEKEVPVCVSVMENEPPSLNVHPFDPGPDQLHVPIHVPVIAGASTE